MKQHFQTLENRKHMAVIPQDKGESYDCPSLLCEEFPGHGTQIGFNKAMFKRQIRVPGSQKAKCVGQRPGEEGSGTEQELWSGLLQSSTECWTTCVWTESRGTRDRQPESSKPNNPRAHTGLGITHVPTSQRWETSPDRASCPHKSLGVKLNWPLTQGCSGSALTKLNNKA